MFNIQDVSMFGSDVVLLEGEPAEECSETRIVDKFLSKRVNGRGGSDRELPLPGEWDVKSQGKSECRPEKESSYQSLAIVVASTTRF